jgi:hypothetical protein
MWYRRLLIGLLTVIVGVWTVPAAAALTLPASPAPAFVRWMLATSTYTSMYVAVDGKQVVVQDGNTLSPYIPLAANQEHTVVITTWSFGAEERPTISTTTGYRLAPGAEQTVIVADDGTLSSPDQAGPIPAGKGLLRPVLAARRGSTSAPTLSFGGKPLNFIPGGGNVVVNQVVEPQTALVEVRGVQGNKVIAAQHLRVQPGYRYEIIVIPQVQSPREAYQLVIVPVSAQLLAKITDTRVFAETGHVVEGRFQHYWNATGGLSVFGFPLNDDRLDQTVEGSFITQVFERNRFEFHPELKAPYDVLLGRLGDEQLRRQGRDWRTEYQSRVVGRDCDAVTVDARTFAVCEPFRSYYRTHGLELDGKPGFTEQESLALFGLPLTQAQEETNSSGDRVLTQWFERARFEHHPRNPAGQQVLLGRLGAEVYRLEPFTFDDEDHNFQRRSSLGSADWREAAGGFGGHYWWACAQSGVQAGWSQLPYRKNAHWEVFIPEQHANSRKVPVTYYSGDMGGIALVNQKPYTNEWIPLGLDLGPTRLDFRTDTGEASDCSYQIAVDAIRMVPGPSPVKLLTGNVTDVLAASGSRLTIRVAQADGSPFTILVDPSGLVFSNYDPATPADVQRGVFIAVQGFSRSGVFEATQATLGLTVEGTITRVDQPTSDRTVLTLTPIREPYYSAIAITSKTIIIVNGQPGNRTSLKAGVRVAAYGNASDGSTLEARKLLVFTE